MRYPVPDSEDGVTVKVTGEGTLIGVDNGDLYYTGIFKTNTRHLYKGKLLIAVRSTEKAGTLTIELNCEKTVPLKLNIKTVK